MTATNASGQIQANVTVTVGQVRILSFTASPEVSTSAGSPVTLAWQTQKRQLGGPLSADLPPQTLPANGTLTINPVTTGNYTVTAYGPSGQAVSVTISVFVR